MARHGTGGVRLRFACNAKKNRFRQDGLGVGGRNRTLTRTGVAGQAVTGLGAGGQRVRAVGSRGRDRRGQRAGGDGRTPTAAASIVMRYVVMVFRTRPGQAVRVLVVGERILVARRHHDHGPGQVRLRRVKVIAAAVARMALERIRFFLLVREEFRLEVWENRKQHESLHAATGYEEEEEVVISSTF